MFSDFRFSTLSDARSGVGHKGKVGWAQKPRYVLHTLAVTSVLVMDGLILKSPDSDIHKDVLVGLRRSSEYFVHCLMTSLVAYSPQLPSDLSEPS